MKNERLLNALGKIDEELIAEAAPGNEKTKRKFRQMKWVKRGAVAASICLILAGAINTLGRLDYGFGAGAGGFLGKIVDGTYYYHEPHKGIMKFTPGEESEQLVPLLHTYWYEDWTVNEYGIYYRQEMSVYVRDHETGTETKLYTSDSVENTHIGFTLTEDSNVIVTNYNKHKEIAYEVLVDGVKGGVLETVMEKTSYDDAKTVYYSDLHYRVGDREITLEPINENRDVFIVLENGENILPKDFYVTNYPTQLEDILILNKYTGIHHGTAFVIYADGTNQVLKLPMNARFSGNNKFLFYPSVSDETVGCADARTGETWLLKLETNGKDYNHNIHNIETDGEYIYTCGPAGGQTTCWKLVYEGGKPVAMSLLDDDIKN